MAQPMRHPNISLKPHQLTLLQRCKDLECLELQHNEHKFKTTVGIIGDKVGSGKSYTILALIYTTLSDTISDTVSFRSVGLDHVTIRTPNTATPVNTCVLVVPHNLVCQWEAYIVAFKELRSFTVKRKPHMAALGSDMGKYDLVLVTSTLFNEFATAHKSLRFKRVFFDEVDNINIPNCSSLIAGFTWFVSASYNNLVYPKGFAEWDQDAMTYTLVSTGLRNKGFIANLFFDLFYKMSPDFIRRLVAANQDEFVDASFRLPPIQEHRVICRSSNAISVLDGVVGPEIIACLNAEDVTTALTHVNPHNKNTEDNIVRVVLDKYNRLAHNAKLSCDFIAQREYDCEEQRAKELGEVMANREELRRKIEHIERRIRDADLCCICLSDIEHKTVTSECCQNSFCFRCITQWVNVRPVCPCCKSDLNMNDLYIVAEGNSEQSSDVGPSNPGMSTCDLDVRNDKMTNFLALLQKVKNGKTLVFSAYDESFGQLSRVMANQGLEYKYIRGASDNVNKVVNSYKNGPTNFLFVNAQNYGSGLNLENTTDIIMFHQFSPEITRQVIGRAQRMGRTQPLNVWYLLNHNETATRTS